MFKKILIIIFLFSVFCSLLSVAYAQQESVTITTYYPSPYGVYKNLRIYPNDDSTPGAACTNEGEMYYDQTDHALYICSGTILTWVAVGGGGGGWSLTGNAGTIAGTNFIGTTDAVGWVVKTNNAERMRITSGGNIGINTASPSSGTGGQLKLDVEGPVGATSYCDKDGNNCRTNVQQVLTGTACSSSQAIRVINPDGTFSCVNLPSSALCTWGSQTYSTGAKCCHPVQVYVCQANGTWAQQVGASCSVLTCGQ